MTTQRVHNDSADHRPLATGTTNLSDKPSTPTSEAAIYTLTLALTPSIDVPLDQLRAHWVPSVPHRTPAHITLFHTLPASHLSLISHDLNDITSATRPYHVSTGRPFRMRNGVGVRLGCGAEASEQLREELRERWEELLGAQDAAAAWVPHWTVVDDGRLADRAAVEKALGTIRRCLCEEAQHGRAVGVTLWRGEGGGVVEVGRWGFRRGTSPGVREEGSGCVEGGKGKSGDGEVLRRVGNKVWGAWKAVKGRRGGGDGVEGLNKDGRRVGDGKVAAGNEERRVGDTGSA